jgi:hypothetical protein
MTTLATLRTSVSDDLRDPDGKVFTAAAVDSMINSALVEVGRIAPARFQEDIDLVENQFEYTLQSLVFTEAIPEIEVNRVELWDATTTPMTPRSMIAPASQAYINFSDTGWSNRDGVLEVPYSLVRFIGSTPETYLLRVWGYRPYPSVSADGDTIPVSGEREQAVRDYVNLLGLKRLVNERDLFTQWQTRAGNTDVSPASMLNAYSIARAEWKERARSIFVLREAAG